MNFEKVIGNCKRCGDERIFVVSSIRERGGITRFVYTCGTCNKEEIESVVALPEAEPKIYDTVLFEVI